MKIWPVCAMIVPLLLGAVRPALGNPPNAIHTLYNPVRGELEVTVQHPVNNRHEHYINEIVLKKNGVEIEKRTFDFQTSMRNQTTPPFKVQVVPGDDVRVLATCNTFGSGETKVEIKPTAGEE